MKRLKDGLRTNRSLEKNLNGTPNVFYDIIVFSHLRWEFVYQRPQHIISRLAKKYKVLFVEEPIGQSSPAEKANIISINANLSIFQPRVDNISDISAVLVKHIKCNKAPVGWFYSAAFSPLITNFSFNKIVFDCMDELSLFKGASEQIVAQEKYLMSEAHIVFTGGKSLYQSKKKGHSNVYCFPSSVDENHFKQALNGLEVPADIAHLPSPVIGYYGVIDERIDLKLLNKVAIQNSNASFVMVGPLAKIEQNDLPKQPNIFYIGMRSYNELPNYLKGFDIAMMPFALNDSTKFISPTKTLEYMAAGKPIISTAIKDVVRDYNKQISIINTAEEFTEAIIHYYNQPSNNFSPMYKEILQATSWDATVEQMDELISELTL
jgi:glycosyltransferase involved in cell wall biosynthesis